MVIFLFVVIIGIIMLLYGFSKITYELIRLFELHN